MGNIPAKKISVGFIGAGNMAYGLIKGIVDSMPDMKIYAHDTDPDRLDFVKEKLGVTPLGGIGEVTQKSSLVFIAVKPYSVESVVEVAAKALSLYESGKSFPIFISIAGGVKVNFIEEVFKKFLRSPSAVKIVRIMPNINSLVGKGMSAMCYNANVLQQDAKTVADILETSSKVMAMDENYFDAVTALSGSGPAYIFLIAEGLIEAGVKLGLPRYIARTLALQTLTGSSALLDSPEFSDVSTKDLKDMVTSPGGTTAYGLAKLEEGRIKYVIDSAVNAAYMRAKGLA